MRQPGPNLDSEAFLSALADELFPPLDPMTAGRHIEMAAGTARSVRSQRRASLVRLTSIVVTLAAILGTGGVAVAGNLPAPIQGVIADAAKSLPLSLPFDIPYPPVTVARNAEATTDHVDRAPEDAEVVVEPHTPAPPPTAPAVPGPAPDQSVDGVDLTRPVREPERPACALPDRWKPEEEMERGRNRDNRELGGVKCSGHAGVIWPGHEDGSNAWDDDDDHDDGDRNHDDDQWRGDDRDRGSGDDWSDHRDPDDGGGDDDGDDGGGEGRDDGGGDGRDDGSWDD